MKKNVYVLMRVYRPAVADKAYEERLRDALKSVLQNKKDFTRCGGSVKLIVNDDSPRQGAEPSFLYGFLGELGFSAEDLFISETGGKGSAYATYKVRSTFLDKVKDPDAVAVTLDQDDRLEKGAIRRIARKMPDDGIVVAPFVIRDSENLDITDDGGRRHSFLARRLSCFIRRWRISLRQKFIPKPRYEKYTCPHGLIECCQQVGHFLHNIGVCWKHCLGHMHNFIAGKRNLPDLSSIGWTKSFSRSILQEYHDSLDEFLLKERTPDGIGDPAEAYFTNHRAYEDFLDFYALLLKDCRIAGVCRATHTYLKHKDSITSSPEVEDFRNHRTAHLIALTDLCYRNREHLREDFEYKLLRFVSTKVYQIDRIISKYRSEFSKEGNGRYDEFAAQTHDGYFISKLCRLALGEDRGKDSPQDRDLFKYATGRGENSKANIERLFSDKHLSSIPEYHLSVKNAPVRFAIRKAVECEKKLAGIHETPREDEKDISALSERNRTPQQRRLRRVFILLILSIAVPVALFLIFQSSINIAEYQALAAAVISIWVALLTFLLNEISKVKSLADEEASLQKLYYSEFLDFIRHLEANLKVMIQVRKRMKESPALRAEDIHFDNLSWPETSCLFSDDMAKIISRDRVDDFSRLKVNIRNINNSSEWLKSAAGMDGKDMLKNLEWEITRHIGYLVNMYYLKTHEFSFGTQNQLDMFLNENSIKNRLTDLFMDYPAKERNDEVLFFLNRYYDDRRMRRDVLVS